MRITRVNIPKGKINNGLEDIHMEGMGQVVLLAGKNGAGKSRLLDIIEKVIEKKPIEHEILAAKESIDDLEKHIQNRKELHNDLKLKNKIDPKVVTKEDLEEDWLFISSLMDEMNEMTKIVNWSFIETHTNPQTDEELEAFGPIPEVFKIFKFIPKQLTLQDPNLLSKKEIVDNFKELDKVDTPYLAKGSLSTLQFIQDRYFNSTHPDNYSTSNEQIDAEIAYRKLQHLISSMLETTLERDNMGEATLFGLPIGKSNLSDGQKILVQLCVALFKQERSLNELILFMDEPENHLHPSVLIDVINRIIRNTELGQVWISTHSIPLLAHFYDSNLWFMEDGKVSYAGNTPEKVLRGLIGEDEEIGKLQDFIGLPAQLAVNRYAFECLFTPSAVMTKGKDPQTVQIRSEIKPHLNHSKKVRVLDYGAGKGRLLANILENESNKILSGLDYIAYDEFNTFKNDCISTLKRGYDDYEYRYFNSENEMFTKYDENSFDIVVMCNVLHEIPPERWAQLFRKGGFISRALSEAGILLLVEDQQIPIGEKAYQKGFLVLDTPELKRLFCITEEDKDFGFSDARNDGRLKAHRLKKEYLERITASSKKAALELLHEKAKKQVLETRSQEVNYKNGKLHAFWVQQYANSGLALTEL